MSQSNSGKKEQESGQTGGISEPEVTFDQAKRLAHQSIELYDTKTNPRVKWTCRKCGQRNDAKLLIPLDTVIVKPCRKCKFMMKFEREKTYSVYRYPTEDKVLIYHSNARNATLEGVHYTGAELKEIEKALDDQPDFKINLEDQDTLKELFREGKARDKREKRPAPVIGVAQ